MSVFTLHIVCKIITTLKVHKTKTKGNIRAHANPEPEGDFFLTYFLM